MPMIRRNIKVARSLGMPNVSWRDLIKRSRAKIKQFEKEFDKYPTPDGPFYFKDNQADILAVANLDWLMPPLHASTLTLHNDKEFYCPTIRSRAGVYAIVDYLPQVMKNNVYDILLTTGKEKGLSSARYFKPSWKKRYKWIFTFETEGTDAVTYQYYGDDITTRLEKAGWKVSTSDLYSDIIDLEHFRCKAISFGIGMYNTDKEKAYLSRNAFMKCMLNFMRFWRANRNEALPHTPVFNAYVIGRGFMYYEDRNNTKCFTAEEMEILDILEGMGYEFEEWVTMLVPEDMPRVIAAYQRSLLNKDALKKAKIALDKERDQLGLFDLDKVQKMYDDAKSSESITGSEDNPDYNKRGISLAKRTRKSGEEVKTSNDVALLVNHIPKEEIEDHMVGLVDECTTCHKPYEFDPKSGKTQCPDCLGTKEDVKLFHDLSSRKSVTMGPGLHLNRRKEGDIAYDYDETKQNWFEVGQSVRINDEGKSAVFKPRRKKEVSV